MAQSLPKRQVNISVDSRVYDNLARRFEIEFVEPQSFTVDGELFPAVRVLTIEAGPAVRFIRG